ncbi:MAG: hypothetical protein D4S01_07345, partial [Dehalococcoidia bacterium]
MSGLMLPISDVAELVMNIMAGQQKQAKVLSADDAPVHPVAKPAGTDVKAEAPVVKKSELMAADDSPSQ